MTIQLSVSIWTIICFILLMLILHHLLFQPVLQVMDARKARIQNAAVKKAEQEKLASEYASMLLQKKAALYEAQQKQMKDEIEAIRVESKKAVEAAKEERLREVEHYRAKAEVEYAEILDTLSVHTTQLAAAFANSLIKE